MDACARLSRKRSFCWNRRAANRLAQREARGVTSEFFPLYSSPSIIIPCALRAGQARGLLWETCGFPPEAPPCNLPRNPPSLSESNVSPSARRPRVPTKASLSEHSDLSARDRMEGHAQAPRHADTLPAVRPGQGFGGSQVAPAPGNPSGGGPGYAQRVAPYRNFMPPHPHKAATNSPLLPPALYSNRTSRIIISFCTALAMS